MAHVLETYGYSENPTDLVVSQRDHQELSTKFSSGRSYEAPARLQNSVLDQMQTKKTRSASIIDDDYLCRLETNLPSVLSTDLPKLIQLTDMGLRSGISPVLVDGATGGTYFLRNSERKICLVFKPAEEEPAAPYNPHQTTSMMGKHRPSYKGGIVPGFGMFREIAAFTVDDGFAGVPPTHVAKVRFSLATKEAKIGSVQSYVRNICTAEEMGSSKFNVDDIQRIAVLDIRLCNLDRHGGNLLVTHSRYHQDSASAMQAQTPVDSFNPLHNEIQPFSMSLEKTSSISSESLGCPSGVMSPLDVASPVSTKSRHTSSMTPSVYRVVPIDHGYCLPHILHISEVNFVWLDWKELDAPLSQEILSYIADLDVKLDILKLRRVIGAAIPDECLLTLVVCTYLLKRGVVVGLTLREIGELIAGDPSILDQPSPLQLAITTALACATVKTRGNRLSSSRQTASASAADISMVLSAAIASNAIAAPPSTSRCSSVVEDQLSSLLSARQYALLVRELEKAVDNLILDVKNRHQISRNSLDLNENAAVKSLGKGDVVAAFSPTSPAALDSLLY